MIIIHARYVIAPGQQVLADHAVVLESDAIVAVAPFDECRKRFPDAEVLDRTDCVVSPGFVNAHMHLYGVLAHGIVPPVPIVSFKGFLEDYWWPLVENQLDAPMIGAACRYTGIELLESGVTALCDVLEAPMAVNGLLAEAAVLDKLGLRAVLSTEACERIDWEHGIAGLEENAAFARWCESHPRLGAMICTHTAFTCSEAFMEEAKAMAKSVGVPLQFHLNESAYEGRWCEARYGVRTCQWYDGFCLLDNDVLAAQGVQLSAKEIAILGDRKVRMVHVPLSNCEVGGGVSPVPELHQAGLVVGLGTDGYVNNFLEVMRGAFLIHKGHRSDPTVMPSRTVWRMATEDGSRVVFGDESRIGRLEAGWKADLAVISLANLPTEATTENLFDQVILFCNPRDVLDVYVDGVPVKQDGRVLVDDKDNAARDVRLQASRLWDQGKALAGQNRV